MYVYLIGGGRAAADRGAVDGVPFAVYWAAGEGVFAGVLGGMSFSMWVLAHAH